MRIDWIEKGFGNGVESWWTVQADYGNNGFFHVYAFTMTLGMIVAVLLSAYRFWKKDLNIIHLAIAAAIIIPFSLFGASIFGKLNADGLGHNANGADFWGLFAFWQAGMSIHGGVLFGLIVGAIIFGIISRKTKVSLWVYLDCIVPNILLAQAIGRFGNFFNHEVMGAPIADLGALRDGFNPLASWIPNWILVNTQVTYNGTAMVLSNGLQIVPGHVYQMAPIFLYEIIGFTLGWFLLTFVVPNFGKWIGPKPWKKHPNVYKFSFKQSFIMMWQPWKYKKPYSANNQSWVGIWNSAYYQQKDPKNLAEFETELKSIKASGANKVQKHYQAVKALNKANNPDHYWTTKSGAEGAGYFFVWNFTRFFLEIQRPENHLFIMYEKDLSLALIMLTALIGLTLMILSQTVVPMFLRQPGWMYEKQYFKSPKIQFKTPKNKVKSPKK